MFTSRARIGEKGKISLGFKRSEDNPWEILKKDYPVGTVTDVQIVGMTTFGAFARIIPGIDGLIHISQIADHRIRKASGCSQDRRCCESEDHRD